MYFNCDKCGRRAFRRTKWRLKNKSFRAIFRCIRCRRDFEGRIVFKRCFDHVEIIKKAVDLDVLEKNKQHKTVKKEKV
jgi:transcription elongation factor Elf1